MTTQYHLHTDDFSQDCVRSCTVQRLDNYGGISESVDRQSCYLMRVDEMYAEVTKFRSLNHNFKIMSKVSNDPSGKPPSTGLFVGCFIDVATGVVRYFIRLKGSSKIFTLSFLPASHARVKRSSRGSRWSPGRSSSPASSSRPPAKMLCRSVAECCQIA